MTRYTCTRDDCGRDFQVPTVHDDAVTVCPFCEGADVAESESRWTKYGVTD